MFKALTEADARRQLASLAHPCGDTTFAPPMKRKHDEHGLWLVFQGPCPRCGQDRELHFHAVAPAQPAPAAATPASAPTQVFRGGSEERELYGTTSIPCAACHGVGESVGVTGDYAFGMTTCATCGGSGWASAFRD